MTDRKSDKLIVQLIDFRGGLSTGILSFELEYLQRCLHFQLMTSFDRAKVVVSSSQPYVTCTLSMK